MLDLAGIFFRGLLIYAEIYEEAGEHFFACIYFACDLHARRSKLNKTVLVHGQITAFAKALYGIGNAGFCNSQVVGDIDGADISVLFLKHEHSFKIVFGRFVYIHCPQVPFIPRYIKYKLT